VIGLPEILRRLGTVAATLVTVPLVAAVGFALITAAPEPAPSVYTMAIAPVVTVTVAPEPCLMMMLWEPEVAFSMIQTLDTVFGARVIVRVAVNDDAEVILRYIARSVSAVPSVIVKVSLLSAAMFLRP
jgi:hypothetical protein